MTNFLETARKMSPGTESCLDSCRDTFFACWIDSLRLKFWKRKKSIIFLHRIAGTYSQLYLASRRIACEIHATEDAHSCKKNGEKKLPKFNVWANANEVSLMVARRQHTSEQAIHTQLQHFPCGPGPRVCPTTPTRGILNPTRHGVKQFGADKKKVQCVTPQSNSCPSTHSIS